MTDPVVTVTPTIQAGTVIRWHRDMDFARNHSPVLSASRVGVLVHNGAYLNTIPAEWIAAATAAYEELSVDRHADLSALATHHPKGLFGPLEPVTKEIADA